MGGRWRQVWRAVDQFGQLIAFRLTARRDAKAARAGIETFRTSRKGRFENYETGVINEISVISN